MDSEKKIEDPTKKLTVSFNHGYCFFAYCQLTQFLGKGALHPRARKENSMPRLK